MKKIVVIEDEDMMQEMLRHILSTSYPDHQIFQAWDGETGYNMICKEIPETILLDIKLPDINGIELCQRIKNNKILKDIPVVMVSSLGNDPQMRLKSLEAGAESFITKPFIHNEFIGIVRVMLRIREAERILKNRNIELNQNIKEKEKTRIRLIKMNNALTQAEEQERRKISEYLHDELGAILAITNMHLSSINPEELKLGTRRKVGKISKLLQKVIENLRKVIYDLSPPILYELGLEAALKWKKEQFERQTNLEVVLNCDVNSDNVSENIMVFAYRIICELLLNAFKHAKASRIEVNVNLSGKNLQISVFDNGIGMDPNIFYKPEENGGFGLYSILDRIESLNGKFNIDFDKNVYTKINVTIPLYEKAE